MGGGEGINRPHDYRPHLSRTRRFFKCGKDQVNVASVTPSFYNLGMVEPRIYKTPAHIRERTNARNHALRAAGGEIWQERLKYFREARKKFRSSEKGRAAHKDKRKGKAFKTHLVQRARLRGRRRGFESTITVADLEWPDFCPVLGIRLEYPVRGGTNSGPIKDGYPSLDRWDCSKGYVPGNVVVISYRANTLKNNATAEELDAVAAYTRFGLTGCVVRDNQFGGALTV